MDVRYPIFLCIDCKRSTFTEYYMVHDDVWLAAGMKHGHRNGDGMLCVADLERRLGRALTREDFTDAVVNRFNAENYSPLLQSRLAA